MPTAPYSTVIERGYTPTNDRIIDYLKPRIRAPWIDIGCNTGWLLSEVPGGVGVDRSPVMVAAARAKGLDVLEADAVALPYDGPFETAVLSCVLEQCQYPGAVITEARRVARRVIGVASLPGASVWGTICGWTVSLLPEDWMRSLGARTEHIDEARYYFEFTR
jgi:SAM-dependent methyltransferase